MPVKNPKRTLVKLFVEGPDESGKEKNDNLRGYLRDDQVFLLEH